MIASLVPLFYLLIFGVPVATVTATFMMMDTNLQRVIAAFFAPLIFTLMYIFTAGMLSRVGARAVIPGIFPRDLHHPVYGLRRLYASAWTSVFYFTPVYFVALSVPILKKVMFRLFGYQFSTNFTVYPDTWLRDLTCVKFEEGAYLANKSTIGTNICLSNGNILVDRIKIGSKTVVGHACILGPGTKTKSGCEISVGTTFGIRAQLHENVKVGAECGISHGAILNSGVEIDNMAHIGTKCVIGPGVKIPPGCHVPAGTTLNTQEDLDALLVNESEALNRERSAMFSRKMRTDRNSSFSNSAEVTKSISKNVG